MTALEIRLACYAFVLVALGAYLAYEHAHLIDEGKREQLATLKASAVVLNQKNDAQIAKLNADHDAAVAANKVKTDADLAAANARVAALNQRVRDFDAYRRSHDASMAGANGGPAAAGGAECGTRSCGERAVQLASAGNELAGSVDELSAALMSCQRDRDSLTGLPRP